MYSVIKCPCCERQYAKLTEQHACIDLFGECIPCRFVPGTKGSGSGIPMDISQIQHKKTNMEKIDGRDGI